MLPTKAIVFCVALFSLHYAGANSIDGQATPAPAAALWPPQVQIAASIPYEPTVFYSADRQYLIYELYLTNYEERTLRVDRIEAIDADSVNAKPTAVFEAVQLNTMMHKVGQPIVGDQIGSADDNSARDIAAGQTAIVFLLVASQAHAQMPARLSHHVLIGGAILEAATISTHHEKIRVVGPPLQGGPWVARSGPSNESHHRRQIVLLNGNVHLSSRFAIDWMRLKNSKESSGDEQDNRSFFSYDQPVLAVGDAKVVSTIDGIPENVPGHFGKGKIAVPISYETIYGNMIVLDLGHGQYAYYGHLKAGSIQVRQGDHVRRGQTIARIGNTGSSFAPHLHFEITTSAKPLRGEGLPYEIDAYIETTKDGEIEKRVHGLPFGGTLVTFVN